MATRSREMEPTNWGLRVTLSVPVWDRKQGPRQETSALAGVAEQERRAAQLEVHSEVMSAWERPVGGRRAWRFTRSG